MTNLEDFHRAIQEGFPALAHSFNEATARGGSRLQELADRIIARYAALCADDPQRLVRCLANLVMEVNKLQLKYELTGHYSVLSYEQALVDVYRNEQRMTDYMLGLVCTQFAWPNHFELFCFFEDRFLSAINPRRVLEIAPGHGLFGVTLLQRYPGASLTGIDISPASILLSRRIAQCFDLARVTYLQEDALHLPDGFRGGFDTIICGELMEHVPDPLLLCRNVANALSPGGVAYVTAAITAAAPDHIYEFKSEDEVLAVFEGAGLGIDSYVCVGTRALTDRAKGPPRTLAAILSAKHHPVEV